MIKLDFNNKNVVFKNNFLQTIDNVSYFCVYEIFYDFFYSIGHRIKFYNHDDIISILFVSDKMFNFSHVCDLGSTSGKNEDDFLENVELLTLHNHHVTDIQKNISNWVLKKGYNLIFDKDKAKTHVIKKCGM